MSLKCKICVFFISLLNVFFAFQVHAIPAEFTSASSTTFILGTASSFEVTTNLDPSSAPFMAEVGSLPQGVTFVNHGQTGTLAGTPASGTAGAYPLVFVVTFGADSEIQQNFTLTVVEETVTTLTAEPAEIPCNPDNLVVLQAAVDSATASGMVTFYNGNTPIGRSPLFEGSAYLLTRLVNPGIYVLSAVYEGNEFNLPSTSDSIDYIVGKNKHCHHHSSGR